MIDDKRCSYHNYNNDNHWHWIRVETLYCKHTGQSANLQWLQRITRVHRRHTHITATQTVGSPGFLNLGNIELNLSGLTRSSFENDTSVFFPTFLPVLLPFRCYITSDIQLHFSLEKQKLSILQGLIYLYMFWKPLGPQQPLWQAVTETFSWSHAEIKV